VLRLATALGTRGHSVRIVAPHAPGLAERDEIDGIAILRVRYAAPERETLAYTGTMAEAVRAGWGGRLALLGLVRALGRTTRAIVAHGDAGWRPDLVHAHWWFPAGLAAVTPRGPGCPLVITMHGSDVRLAMQLPGAPRLARQVLRRARVRTAVSRWLAEQAMAFGGGAVEAAPMPIDDDVFTPGAHDDRPGDVVLFVGRLNRQKGVHHLLTAAALATAPVRLRVVGDGPDRAALEAQAAALGLSDRITWLPSMTPHRLADEYRRAAVVAMPSEGEGLGLVGVEAQACGTPVVAFASGGLVDVVRDGETGCLVPAGDAPAMARALDALLEHPDRRAAMGRAGVAHVRDRFSPAAVGERYAALLHRALT
jgi:glycosyltransferase involved in cell wall biosynthesis